MIYGLVPIGGKGSRLGLTFSKEMLPQKGFLHFNPISNHLVQAMMQAGAQKIIFIHGFEFKVDVQNFFDGPMHHHFVQKSDGFSNVLFEFVINVAFESVDKILFGMPDTIFNGNPFLEMINKEGIDCALFTTNDQSKVDRLYKDKKICYQKTKMNYLQNRFWGLLKFDGVNLKKMEKSGCFAKHKEIGTILNEEGFSCTFADEFLDLGTWDNYNYYLKHFET